MGQGDVDGVLALLADEITWTIPGPAVVPYAGTFHGSAMIPTAEPSRRNNVEVMGLLKRRLAASN